MDKSRDYFKISVDSIFINLEIFEKDARLPDNITIHTNRHGEPTAEARHVDDLGNVEADESGNGSTYDQEDDSVTLNGPSLSLEDLASYTWTLMTGVMIATNSVYPSETLEEELPEMLSVLSCLGTRIKLWKMVKTQYQEANKINYNKI